MKRTIFVLLLKHLSNDAHCVYIILVMEGKGEEMEEEKVKEKEVKEE